jgi:hypothetical protein
MIVCDYQGDKIGTVRQVYLGAVTEGQDKRGLEAATPSAAGREEASFLADVAKVAARMGKANATTAASSMSSRFDLPGLEADRPVSGEEGKLQSRLSPVAAATIRRAPTPS